MHKPRWVAALLATLLTAAVVGTATPAQAALPDQFGFVLFNGSVVATGTRPAATTVTVNPTGTMTIRFPGIGAKYGVVHITAVNEGPRWCQAIKWAQVGVDEVAEVACFATGGVLVPTGFSAFFESSSGPAGPINGKFGYVDVLPSGALVSQYNSAGLTNAVGSGGVGLTDVKFPGLGTPTSMDGSFQATAVNGSPARCTIAYWTSYVGGQLARVACFDAAGNPFATRFTLTYQYQQSLYGAGWPPKYFGYLWSKPLGGPPSTNFNSQLFAGANSVSGSAGLYQVVFPQLAQLPDNLQVTSTNTGSAYCNLTTAWLHSGTTTVARSVACYNSAGTRVPAGFTISANSAA